MNDWIQTYTGKKFFLQNESMDNLDDICIEDIAHALSNICRYNGHSKQFYSVAEHSVLVSYAVTPEFALWGLMHDASEAYLSDIPRPFKSLIANYRTLEANLMARICKKYDMPIGEPVQVKNADTAMLHIEAQTLMRDGGLSWAEYDKYRQLFYMPGVMDGLWKCPYITWTPTGINQNVMSVPCWNPAEAEHKFLARFLELKGY